MAQTEKATLAGGCFWCLEAVYELLDGVSSVKSGYAGGHDLNPSYEQVCSGVTGHAEVVRILFDPDVITYRDLLDVFFTIHDPTTLNRQGWDQGTQYRSAIFFETPEQEATARDVIADLGKREVWEEPIVTEVVALDAFFPAEEYHDQYYQRNPAQPYCQMVIAPKVQKARAKYLSRLRRAEV
ncbi:MAG: peptide-methionine (S)-S-oxide reductase MsrA [Chloroflexi bacterium]|nr:peptide-methionine (S)-S-oxide reductase MsrA [Chloroflexota bacterium]